jgi:hypothetical protein
MTVTMRFSLIFLAFSCVDADISWKKDLWLVQVFARF